MQIETISFMLGAFLLFIAILGGGIEIKELKIPRVGHLARSLSAIIGITFVTISLWHGGLFDTSTKAIPVAQAPSVPPVTAEVDTRQPAISQQQAVAQPAPVTPPPATITQSKKPTPAVTQARTGKESATTSTAKTATQTTIPEIKPVPVATPPKPNPESEALAKLDELRKKVAFTIKVGLGTTPNAAETETEMRIYLQGKKKAQFNLNLQSPSQSASIELDKPGEYKYYIEGHTSWNNIPNKKIPMEGEGVLTVKESGGIYELWSTAAPTAKTQTWEVGLRSK